MLAPRQTHRTRQLQLFNLLGYYVLLFIITCIIIPHDTYAATYSLNGDTIGDTTLYTVQEDDTLYDIARQFDLGITDVLTANPGVDPWMPKEESELKLPTMHILPPAPRKGIVINLAELRLYFFPDPETVMTFPLGIGQEGWQTPVGHTTVAGKRKDPTWIPPASIRREDPDLPAVFPPGPDNPLGAFALDLDWPVYRIHGTNRPYGIGWRSSHGCIRMYPEDIEELFPHVAIGTPVTVVDTPYKLGWKDNELWLEISPTQQQVDEVAEYKEPMAIDIPGIHGVIENAVGSASDVDWYAVDNAIAHPNGLPVMIALRYAP